MLSPRRFADFHLFGFRNPDPQCLGQSKHTGRFRFSNRLFLEWGNGPEGHLAVAGEQEPSQRLSTQAIPSCVVLEGVQRDEYTHIHALSAGRCVRNGITVVVGHHVEGGTRVGDMMGSVNILRDIFVAYLAVLTYVWSLNVIISTLWVLNVSVSETGTDVLHSDVQVCDRCTTVRPSTSLIRHGGLFRRHHRVQYAALARILAIDECFVPPVLRLMHANGGASWRSRTGVI